MAIPKDAQEMFNERVPRALEQHPDKAKEVDAIYCFKITGDGGGEWTVNLTADPPTIKGEDDGSAQCTFEVAHDDFKTMLSDPQSGMQLYFEGKLQVAGDPMLATKLKDFLEMAAQAPA